MFSVEGAQLQARLDGLLPTYRPALAYVLINGAVAGTAWLFDAEHALTAFHVVQKHPHARDLSKVILSLVFPSGAKDFAPVPSDTSPDLDFSVLKILPKQDVPTAKRLPVTGIVAAGPAAIWGFAQAVNDKIDAKRGNVHEIPLTATLDWTNRIYRGTPSLQLTVGIDRADTLHQCSGGPVFDSAGSVIGLVRQYPDPLPHDRIVFATSIRDASQVSTILAASLAASDAQIAAAAAQNERRARVPQLKENLGAAGPATRSSAAVDLAEFVEDDPTVASALAHALQDETAPSVQRAIERALRRGGRHALGELRQLRVDMGIELPQPIGEIYALAQRGLDKESAELERDVFLKHGALVGAVQLIHELEQALGHEAAVPDYSGLPLARFRFDQQTLNGVNFAAAGLNAASFVRCSLIGANFTYAMLQSAYFGSCNLRSADFTRLKLHKVTVGPFVRPARFVDCDMSDARFGGAALSGGDFTGARGLTVDQLKDADIKGAQFESGLAAQLAQAGLL